MQEELVIHIKEDSTVFMEIKEGKTVKTKVVSPEALIKAIKSSLTGRTVKTGLLPQHILNVTMNTENDSRYVTFEFPDSVADITYMETEYKNFPLPRLVFGIKISSSGRIEGVNLGVPALGKLREDTVMYYYPFSNVNRFSMCTGANALPHIKSLTGLENLSRFIISLPDNDDYFNSKHNKPNLEHRDLLELLKDKDTKYYYDEILIPMPDTTLKDFI